MLSISLQYSDDIHVNDLMTFYPISERTMYAIEVVWHLKLCEILQNMK